MNKAQLATVFGVSTETISAWCRKGCPFKTRGRHGHSYTFHLTDVVAWRVEDLHNQSQAERKSGTPSDAFKRKAEAEAELKEMELAKARGDLLHRDMVSQVFTSGILSCRSRLLSIPTKTAPLLISCKTIQQIQQVLQKVIDDALTELADVKLSEEPLSGHDGAVGTTAARDRKRVGRSKATPQSRKQRRARPVEHRSG